MEKGPEDVPLRHRPYAAWITVEASPACVAAALGHHVCFPLGIRDCHVAQQGQKMIPRAYYDVDDGALIIFQIDRYPWHVDKAAKFMDNAEQFFIIARSVYERYCTPPWRNEGRIILRVHGVSPQNRPLGSRDYTTTFHDLAGLSWLQHIGKLWPFYDRIVPKVVFAPGFAMHEPNEEGVTVFHFIVGYTRHLNGESVLVEQTMTTRDQTRTHAETWAITLDTTCADANIRNRLRAPPFWVTLPFTPSFRRNRMEIQNEERDWMAGEVLEIHVQVANQHDLLHAMLTFGADAEPEEAEAIAFLQHRIIAYIKTVLSLLNNLMNQRMK